MRFFDFCNQKKQILESPWKIKFCPETEILLIVDQVSTSHFQKTEPARSQRSAYARTPPFAWAKLEDVSTWEKYYQPKRIYRFRENLDWRPPRPPKVFGHLQTIIASAAELLLELKALRVMCDWRGHPSGWPKLPAGPPKFIEVLKSLKDMLHESENAHHAGCSILRCAHRFGHDLDTI